jgi:hypothetical protein
MRDTVGGEADPGVAGRGCGGWAPAPVGGPPPAGAVYAVEARPARESAPQVFFFATCTEATAFAERIRAWPGPRPLLGRILGVSGAGRVSRGLRIGEGAGVVEVEAIEWDGGRPWA